MTPTDLTARVTRAGLPTVAALAAGAWLLAGAGGAAGVAGGGAVALLGFRWLARDVGRAAALLGEGRARTAGLAGTGLRQLVTMGALALLVASGWAHPLGVAIGLAILPPILLAEGLRAARHSG